MGIVLGSGVQGLTLSAPALVVTIGSMLTQYVRSPGSTPG